MGLRLSLARGKIQQRSRLSTISLLEGSSEGIICKSAFLPLSLFLPLLFLLSLLVSCDHGTLRSAVFQGEGDSFSIEVHTEHRDADFLVDFDDVRGILDKTVRKLADMDEPILMDANVDKDTKSRDVRDDPGEFHPRPYVLQFFHSLCESKRFVLVSRVAAGFGEFRKDIIQRGKTHVFSNIVFQVDSLPERLVAHQIQHRTVQVSGHGMDDR